MDTFPRCTPCIKVYKLYEEGFEKAASTLAFTIQAQFIDLRRFTTVSSKNF